MRISDWSSDVCSSDLQGADCCDATTLAQLVTDLGRDGVVALIDELIAAAPADVQALREAHEAAASMPAAQTLAVSSRSEEHTSELRSLMRTPSAASPLSRKTRVDTNRTRMNTYHSTSTRSPTTH